MKLPLALIALTLLLPATAAAQTPPPDERAAAQALADAAKRVSAASDEVFDDAPAFVATCRALYRRVPKRHRLATEWFVNGLEARDFIDRLKPAVLRMRSEIAQVQTADPALISGRAAARRVGRELSAFPEPVARPCAAYKAFVRAGYPRHEARAGRAIVLRLSEIATPELQRKPDAAADRMVALGVPAENAEIFRNVAG